MKNLLFLLLLLPFISHAQPDYKKDIYIKDKRCVQHNFGNGRDIKHYGNRIYSLSQYYAGIGIPADAQLIIMDKNFDTIKTVRYGGSAEDILGQIALLPNGNLLLMGKTSSKDGDVPYGANYPTDAAWLLEVDTNGVIKKGRCFGGNESIATWDVIVSKTGGIYVAGGTSSNDQDFLRPVPNGSLDFFAFKFDTAFNIIWKYIPHTTNNGDGGCTVTELTNGNIIVSYIVSDTNQVVLGNLAKGNDDFIVCCFKEDGTLIWQKRFGGLGSDTGGMPRYDSVNQKIYFIGNCESLTGDQNIEYNTSLGSGSSQNTLANNVVVIIDTAGNLLHFKAYGHKNGYINYRGAWSLLYNNNLWVVRNFNQGQVCKDDYAGNQYPLDDTIDNAWIGIIDSNANLIARYSVKSNQVIIIQHLLEVDGKLFALGGSGNYPVVNGTNNFSCDTNQLFWFILELGEAPLGTKNYTKENKPELFTLYPNPTDNELFIKINEAYKSEKYSLDIYTLDGKKINSENGKATIEPIKINTRNYTSGKYLVQLKLNQKKESKTFIKK